VVLLACGPAAVPSGAATSQPRPTPAAVPVPPAPASDPGFVEALQSADPAARQRMLEEFLRRQIAEVLGMPPAEVDVNAPVQALGLDALMAIQLKNRVEPQIGVPVPVTAFLEGASGAQIVRQLLARFGETPDEPVIGNGGAATAAAERDVDQMLARV